MTVDEAIETAITRLTEKPTTGNNGYAITYLKGIPQAVREYPDRADEAKRVQVLYALSNMASWHGPEARRVKEVLKAYASPKSTSSREK